MSVRRPAFASVRRRAPGGPALVLVGALGAGCNMDYLLDDRPPPPREPRHHHRR